MRGRLVTAVASLGIWALAPSQSSAQTPGIHVFLYHFELQLPDTGVAFQGSATVVFRQFPGARDTLALDLIGMHVDSVLNPTLGDAATNQFHYDGHVLAMRSRFLPDRLLDLFERRTHRRGGPHAMSLPQPAVRVNVAARMREMWK